MTDLLPFPPAHHSAPSGTSEAAAKSIAPQTPTMRETVRTLIEQAGPDGIIDETGARRLGMRQQTYTPRRRELAQAGLVVESGRRQRTTSGRTAAVWIAREHAPQREAGTE